MDKYVENIEGNAIDTLEEGIRKLNLAIEKNDNKSYKFAILHLSNYLELLFKLYIQSKHSLFIFKNPFSENLNKSKALTITFWDSVNFIENENLFVGISKIDLEFLKKLRNNIEHFEFNFEPVKVKETIFRIFDALEDFPNFNKHMKVLSEYSTGNSNFDRIMKEYGNKFQEAKSEIEKSYNTFKNNQISGAEDHFYKYLCSNCKYPFMIKNTESESGYQCTYCENKIMDSFCCCSCGYSGKHQPLADTIMEDSSIEKRCYPTCSIDEGFRILN